MNQQGSTFSDIIMLIGRVCFAAIFIMAGYQKILNFAPTTATMVQEGIPFVNILLIVSIIMEFGGGVLILFGWFARFGGLLIFAFIIPVTYYFHDFWTLEPALVVNQMAHFMKNLAMVGGALFIVANGAGGFSIDAWRSGK